jgi:hypothetical protein
MMEINIDEAKFGHSINQTLKSLYEDISNHSSAINYKQDMLEILGILEQLNLKINNPEKDVGVRELNACNDLAETKFKAAIVNRDPNLHRIDVAALKDKDEVEIRKEYKSHMTNQACVDLDKKMGTAMTWVLM